MPGGASCQEKRFQLPRNFLVDRFCQNRTANRHRWTGISVPRRAGKPSLRNSAIQLDVPLVDVLPVRGTGNSKHEIRNTKQIRMSKISNSKKFDKFGFRILKIVSDLEFIISSFPPCGRGAVYDAKRLFYKNTRLCKGEKRCIGGYAWP